MIRKANCKNDIEKAAEIYEKIEKLELEGAYHTGWKLGIYPTYQTADGAYSADELYVFEDENENIAASAIIISAPIPIKKESGISRRTEMKSLFCIRCRSIPT